ncbi:MAG: TIGR02186 family protein [Alphaproteobacteria bacterium]|nr:TIGR02186 family protein [Alphaproteobacteria bacterium]
MNTNAAYAQDIRTGDHLVTQVSNDFIDVSAGFGGAVIDLFGDRNDANTDVAIVVEGPKRRVTIWQKEQVMGAWVNRYFVSFDSVPVFYSYALDKRDFIINNSELSEKHNVGIEALFKEEQIRKSRSIDDIEVFRNALVEERKNLGVFPQAPEMVEFLNPYFFRARFKIPQSVPTGEYKIHTYLVKDGAIIDRAVQAVSIKQVGINGLFLRMAKENSFFYGLGCILFAFIAGWFVSAVRVKV